MAFSDPLVVNSASFYRIKDGYYEAGTAGLTNAIELKSTLVPDGVSSFKIGRKMAFPNADPAKPDHIVDMYFVFRGDMGLMTDVDIRNQFAFLTDFIVTNTANLPKIRRGEL